MPPDKPTDEPSSPAGDVRAVFARYDADRSSDIDRAELRTALNALGLSTDTAQAAAVLAKYDTDASGRLEYSEFKQLIEELRAFQARGMAAPPPAPAHRTPPTLDACGGPPSSSWPAPPAFGKHEKIRRCPSQIEPDKPSRTNP